MGSAEHTTLDGSRVSLTGSLDLGEPATSIGVLQGHGGHYELTAGVRELAVWIITEVLRNPDPSEAYSMQGGTLRVSHRHFFDPDPGMEVDVWAGAWEGGLWSLYGHMYGMDESTPLLDLFGGVEIVERPDGLTAVPGPQGGKYEAPPIIAKRSPGVGIISVERLTADLASSLPSSAGTAVAGGDLYFDDSPPHFVLVGSKAVVTSTVESDADVTASGLENLVVEWTDPQ